MISLSKGKNIWELLRLWNSQKVWSLVLHFVAVRTYLKSLRCYFQCPLGNLEKPIIAVTLYHWIDSKLGQISLQHMDVFLPIVFQLFPISMHHCSDVHCTIIDASYRKWMHPVVSKSRFCILGKVLWLRQPHVQFRYLTRAWISKPKNMFSTNTWSRFLLHCFVANALSSYLIRNWALQNTFLNLDRQLINWKGQCSQICFSL